MKRSIIATGYVVTLVVVAISKLGVFASTFGSGYALHPHAGQGSSAPSILHLGELPLVVIVTILVVIGCITVSTSFTMYLVHKYYLTKNLSGSDMQPYLVVVSGAFLVFITTLILAFTVVFSLWYVILALWVTSLLGFLIYKIFTVLEGRQFQRGDISKAFTLSSSVITLILLLFV